MCLKDVSVDFCSYKKFFSHLMLSVRGVHRHVFFAGTKLPVVLKLDECQIVKGRRLERLRSHTQERSHGCGFQ